MAKRKKREERDIEKTYPRARFIEKLRRLADCLEQDKRFRIQIDGERVSIPPSAIVNIEHERGSSEEEIEFLKRLRFKGIRPTPLYYYREVQNLRDPLHFRNSPAESDSRPKRAAKRRRRKLAG